VNLADIVDKEGEFNAMFNFNNVLEASLSVFIVIINDGWSKIYFEHTKSTGNIASTSIYFISLLICGQLVLLNIFLIILMANFESDSKE